MNTQGAGYKKGETKSRGKKFAIVAARFNDFITKRLLEGCLKELSRWGVDRKEITVVWVPGSFEIPLVAMHLARNKNIAVVICLGAVIRGETLHFELIAQAAAVGIAQVALMTGKPVIFGVLTTDTVDQAYKRCDPRGNHKGIEAARNAVEMVNLLSQPDKRKRSYPPLH